MCSLCAGSERGSSLSETRERVRGLMPNALCDEFLRSHQARSLVTWNVFKLLPWWEILFISVLTGLRPPQLQCALWLTCSPEARCDAEPAYTDRHAPIHLQFTACLEMPWDGCSWFITVPVFYYIYIYVYIAVFEAVREYSIDSQSSTQHLLLYTSTAAGFNFCFWGLWILLLICYSVSSFCIAVQGPVG